MSLCGWPLVFCHDVDEMSDECGHDIALGLLSQHRYSMIDIPTFQISSSFLLSIVSDT